MTKIEILGNKGCARCEELKANARAWARRQDQEYEIVKIDDLQTVAQRGVMSTPGLAVDGEVVATGRVLGIQELDELLS